MHSNALRRVGLEGVRHTAGALPRPAPPAFRSTVGCSCFFLLLTRAHVTFTAVECRRVVCVRRYLFLDLFLCDLFDVTARFDCSFRCVTVGIPKIENDPPGGGRPARFHGVPQPPHGMRHSAHTAVPPHVGSVVPRACFLTSLRAHIAPPKRSSTLSALAITRAWSQLPCTHTHTHTRTCNTLPRSHTALRTHSTRPLEYWHPRMRSL